METRPTPISYRHLRWRDLNRPEYSHLKLLLYWPVFGLLFFYAERLQSMRDYHVVHCALDDLIPFNELFLIPYLFWFVFLIGMHLYTLRYDVETFRKMMHFIILTYSAALVLFFLFPTCQHLRPEVFPRDNALTRFMAAFYRFDTNTNVCPSLHVVGSLAVVFAAWHSPRFQTRGWRAAFAVTGGLISVSTVFLKQHSLWDVAAALAICAVAYDWCYRREDAQGSEASEPLWSPRKRRARTQTVK